MNTRRGVLLLVLLVLVLAGCTIIDGKVGPLVNIVMIWQADWPYNHGDTSLVEEGADYTQYSSLQDNNVGHHPPSSPVWWENEGRLP